MDIIPVIDVRHARVVSAARGHRAAYTPIETPLAAGSDPVYVARGYVSLFTVSTLYVADLDGIEGRDAATALRRGWPRGPGDRLWVDDGGSAREACSASPV